MASPSFQVRVLLRPDIPRIAGGGFRPTTFDHLLQRRVEIAGLDPRWIHTLIGAQVAPDGESAELTIHSQPQQPKDLTNAFRILNGTPAAQVRAVTPEGEVLVECQMPAPLRPGQRVQIAGADYTVSGTEWPGRDSNLGVCEGQLDWQHATVHPVQPITSLPVPVQQVTDPRGAGRRRASEAPPAVDAPSPVKSLTRR